MGYRVVRSPSSKLTKCTATNLTRGVLNRGAFVDGGQFVLGPFRAIELDTPSDPYAPIKFNQCYIDDFTMQEVWLSFIGDHEIPIPLQD